MLPNILLGSFMPNSSRNKKTNGRKNLEVEAEDLHMRCSIPFNKRYSVERPAKLSLRVEDLYRKEGTTTKKKKKGEMSNKVSNFSDLIQRVAASCLLHPLASSRHHNCKLAGDDDDDEDYECESSVHEFEDAGEEEEEFSSSVWTQEWKKERKVRTERGREAEMLMVEVFEAVSEMKRAYVSLQEAHCPWDPEKMRVADVAVVAELRRLGVLRERFRRSTYGESTTGGGEGRNYRRRGGGGGGEMLREVVAPYEAAVEELKREVKAREVDVENLKEKLRSVSNLSSNSNGNGKKGRSHHQSKRRISCSSHLQGGAPTPDLFEATMSQVKDTSKSFASLLLSLMRSANWDIAAAVRSIEVAFNANDATASASASATTMTNLTSIHHAKYVLESYVSRKIFQGFDHETFYMDGSLSSLLQPDQFRKDCFAQYRDMKAMDPIELLGILPTCNFGKFCSRKYLSILNSKMEESLFGDLEQQRQVLAGNHPRSQFYGEFLGVAKAVWLLHLLAFSLEPSPSHFEASRGAEFHPQYMESVVRFSSGRVPTGQTVGFPVTPGFKLGNGSVIKSRVYLVSRS